MPAAFPDFWRMIWEYDIPTIVMVTNLREDDKVRLYQQLMITLIIAHHTSQIKCHQYWPSYGSMVYGNLQVTLREVENLADYSIRTFQVAQVSYCTHYRKSAMLVRIKIYSDKHDYYTKVKFKKY